MNVEVRRERCTCETGVPLQHSIFRVQYSTFPCPRSKSRCVNAGMGTDPARLRRRDDCVRPSPHEGPTARHKPARAAGLGKTAGPEGQRAEGPTQVARKTLCRAFSPLISLAPAVPRALRPGLACSRRRPPASPQSPRGAGEEKTALSSGMVPLAGLLCSGDGKSREKGERGNRRISNTE